MLKYMYTADIPLSSIIKSVQYGVLYLLERQTEQTKPVSTREWWQKQAAR